MVVATFDTLKYFNTLKAAGVPEKQAEAQTTVLAEALAVNLKDLVTKDDLHEAEQRMNARIDLVRTELSAKIDSLQTKYDGKINLLTWMLGVAISMLIAVLVRLFFFRIS